MTKCINDIVGRVRAKIVSLVILIYCWVYKPIKIWQIRHKQKIKVGFVIGSLGAWKTETLYQAMLRHPRFIPMLLVLRTREEDDTKNIITYLKDKRYNYVSVGKDERIKDNFHSDILFYQKPYADALYSKHSFKHNLYAVFCYTSYAFYSVIEKWSVDNLLQNIAWQLYFENKNVVKETSTVMQNKCKNGHSTGIPIMDELLVDKNNLADPWKPQSHCKKKIIWAPHHSINIDNWVVYSTFLQYADFMLELAVKYKDEVQFAFKPHPLLRHKLEQMWSKDKIASYYAQWTNMENTQFESGKYLGLFKYSDAMIHDCGSFTIEYHYTLNPVLYVLRDEHHSDNLNLFAKKAFDLHYKAYSKEDIEQFIQNVIDGKDDMREERIAYYQENLLPPNRKSACENIINTILYDA